MIINEMPGLALEPTTAGNGQILNGYTAYDGNGNKLTGNIASKSSSDMTVSGAQVTAPAGYYASNSSKSVSGGSATTPATTITSNPAMSFNASTGVVTASNSHAQSVTPTVSAGYISSGTAGYITVLGSNTYSLTVYDGSVS